MCFCFTINDQDDVDAVGLILLEAQCKPRVFFYLYSHLIDNSVVLFQHRRHLCNLHAGGCVLTMDETLKLNIENYV